MIVDKPTLLLHVRVQVPTDLITAPPYADSVVSVVSIIGWFLNFL